MTSMVLLSQPSVAAAAAKKASKIAAVAAAAAPVPLHTGQKIANFVRQSGLPDLAVLAIISALPVVELRGAIPVGIWMGLPLSTVLPISIIGNMIPILPILFLLKNPAIKKLFSPVLDRAEKKTSELGIGSPSKQWISLAAFVGVPLPGTGAWTGAMGAFLLGMPLVPAITSIFAGVVSAGCIMSAITLAGKKGGIAALAVLFAVTIRELLKKDNKKQDFLEAEPYWDQSSVPVNVYKNKEPFIGKVVSTKRIVGPQATGETCHIIIDHKGKFPYWEGQSWGVIPPGVREKDGKPHSVRLYSIASSRYGDDMTGNTGSLCVRRATYWCPELKADDPAKKGICSNFLCDTKPGEAVSMTGPAGKVMLLPEQDPATDYIMVATGTGIAPYRGFVRRLFVERTPAAEAYKGQAWLFLGVANSDALLYDDEWQVVKEKYPDNFRLDYALSREQNNKKGGKMYIQDKVEEYADEVFNKLENGAHIYFCGLKGMMPGIQDMLKTVAQSKGINYDEWLKGLKEKKQWHVEVY
jgi:ferredoxin--NADP+ reductase